jgi:hypothetical protein
MKSKPVRFTTIELHGRRAKAFRKIAEEHNRPPWPLLSLRSHSMRKPGVEDLLGA